MEKSKPLQLNYSDLYAHELKEESSRIKKAKFVFDLLALNPDICKELNVLEIGCHTGVFAKELGSYFKSWTAIDIDEQALRIAKLKNLPSNVFFEFGNAEAMSFDSDKFDIIICNHIYEHVPKPENMFAEILRVMKAGSVCYFSAGNRWNLIEPHHRIIFLSWIPNWAANIALSIKNRKVTKYYEKHLTRSQILNLIGNFQVADITSKAIDLYFGEVSNLNYKGKLARLVTYFMEKYLKNLFPTYIFLLKKAKL